VRIFVSHIRDTCQCCIFVLDLVRCQVLMATSVTVIAFWDIAPYSLVEVDLRNTPETSVSIYEATRPDIPEESHLQVILVLQYYFVLYKSSVFGQWNLISCKDVMSDFYVF
jgi:hypothetical protein